MRGQSTRPVSFKEMSRAEAAESAMQAHGATTTARAGQWFHVNATYALTRNNEAQAVDLGGDAVHLRLGGRDDDRDREQAPAVQVRRGLLEAEARIGGRGELGHHIRAYAMPGSSLCNDAAYIGIIVG